MRATQRQRLRATQRQRLRGRRGNNDSFIWQAMMFLVLLPQAVSRAEPGKRRLSRRINKATAQGMCMAFACLALFLSVPEVGTAQWEPPMFSSTSSGASSVDSALAKMSAACTISTPTVTPKASDDFNEGGVVEVSWTGAVIDASCPAFAIWRADGVTDDFTNFNNIGFVGCVDASGYRLKKMMQGDNM